MVGRIEHAPVVVGALDPEGSAARSIDDLWWLMLALGTAVLVLVLAVLIVGLLRRTSQDDDGDDIRSRRAPAELTGSSRATRWSVLGGGVVLPAVVVAVVLVATVATMRAIDTDEPAAFEIEVVGHQWWWEVSYPDQGVVTANELHLPVDTQVDVLLRSADVIHSFWVPSLAGKLDALPERTNRLRIDARRPGTYDGVCAEFCGVQHANMRFTVVAHSADDFERWVAQQAEVPASPTAAVAAGRDVFVQQCGTCHTVAGTGAAGRTGPDLSHLMSRRTLAGGLLTTEADDLRRWIVDPHSIKPGTRMPAAELTDDQVDAVVTYLRTLQ